MTMTECPSNGTLTELAAEGMDPGQVLDHLETCATCRSRFEEIRAILGGLSLLISATEIEPTPLPTRRTPAVIGKYFVVGKMSSGRGVTTYRAVQASMQTNEFVIILADEPWENPETLQPTLELAAGPLEQLDHSSIARAEDVGLFDDRPYIAYKFIDGEPFERTLASRSLTTHEVARIAADLARALASAHRSGQIHGSFAMTSVRINREGRPVITDFAALRLLLDPSNRPDPAVDVADFGAILRSLAENSGSKALKALGIRAGSADLAEMTRVLDRLSRPTRRMPWISAAIVVTSLAAGLWWLVGR
jgi:serine/threonine protein kinase